MFIDKVILTTATGIITIIAITLFWSQNFIAAGIILTITLLILGSITIPYLLEKRDEKKQYKKLTETLTHSHHEYVDTHSQEPFNPALLQRKVYSFVAGNPNLSTEKLHARFAGTLSPEPTVEKFSELLNMLGSQGHNRFHQSKDGGWCVGEQT